MQSDLVRHKARQSSIDAQLASQLSSLKKPHSSALFTLELKHEAPALIVLALLHTQIGTLKDLTH